MRETVLEELHARGVLPFMREHVTVVHSPHDGRPATDGYGVPLSGQAADAAVQRPMAPLYGYDAEPVLGVAVLPVATAIRNLSVAARLSCPGLGVEGQLITALAAANRIAPPSKARVGGSVMLGRG